jgi:glycosyltransferase involved in cell wall biosynthesis
VKVLFLTAHPGIQGPLPKLGQMVVDGLEACGLDVETECWSRHREQEGIFEKLVGRTGDLLRIRRHLKRRPVAVLFVTTTHDVPALLRDIPLVLATRHLCAATVLQFHGSMCDRLGAPGTTLFTRASIWLVRHCSAVLLLSREEVGEWRRWVPGARFELVHNPFVPPIQAAEGRQGADDSAVLTVLFVGRLEPQKGILELLSAFAVVRRSVNCRLMLAGSGDATRVRRIATDAGIADSVEITGYLSGESIWHAYAVADIFVLPSHREGFPTVILEAMSFGLPVVTTGIRGVADMLVEEENALFVPVGDSQSLAAALVRLLEDADLRASMGARNRTVVDAFAPSVVMPRYAAILRDAMPEGEASRA